MCICSELRKEYMNREPRHERQRSKGFLTRSGTNQAVQPHKMVRGLKFWIKGVEIVLSLTKTKLQISCTVTEPCS